jgi:CRISPR-associated endonuclease/helicase Cas3
MRMSAEQDERIETEERGDENRPDVPRVDVVFRVTGESVPVDHGYALFGAIAQTLGEDLHGAWWLAIAGLRGTLRSRGELGLRGKGAELRLRVTYERVPSVLALAGKNLDVGGRTVLVGTSRLWMLRPARVLRARIVTTKIHGDLSDAERFRAGFIERLKELGVKARVELGERRVVRVREQLVAGYQCTLRDLSEQDSLRVLNAGVGGRRRFGCGVFMAGVKEFD